MKQEKNYYLGLDIGTDSVGYAVTDEQYNILKFHGEPAWGVTIFDAANLCDERRSFRSARRRLDRKKQRINFLQELFSEEINKVDPMFWIRLQESRLFRDEAGDAYTLFNDPAYTDADYHKEYPTIHHLIVELMKSSKPHDIRLVYLACSWLISHRGHFFSNIQKGNIEAIKDFTAIYERLMGFFRDNGYDAPWEAPDLETLAETIRRNTGVNEKSKALQNLLYGEDKPSKEISDSFPFDRVAIIKLLAGGSCKLLDIFGKEEYADMGSISLRMDDDKMNEILSTIGDDSELLLTLRSISDWALLVDVIGNHNTISEAKVAVYEQHKQDLCTLKYMIKRYIPKRYHEIFRNPEVKDNYVAYSYHVDGKDTSKIKKASSENFLKKLEGIVKEINPDKCDSDLYEKMFDRIKKREFLPKQKNVDNRVIPHQLYWFELNRLLKTCANYLIFLNESDDDGLTVLDKIMSIFMFRVPYFVGPLNTHSEHAWLVRKAGKICPWNFEKMVDLDASEQAFINRMTNHCSYLPGEPVLPKDSLLYHRYMVLNEINNFKIDGVRISVELKQEIFNNVFLKYKKVTKKKLVDYLLCNGYLQKGNEEALGGIDININSNLKPQIAFMNLLSNNTLTVEDVEKIIERSSYAEDKSRFKKWLTQSYPNLAESDQKYICNLKFKDFGRLSKRFLTQIEGADKETGEIYSIIEALWNTQNNLMELLSGRFTFREKIDVFVQEYYLDHPVTLKDRLNDMYVSNAVKRPIYRTLDIVKDVVKAFGEPKKIFIETTRGANPDQKGKRTKTRKQQILDLYDVCEEDVRELTRQLTDMGDSADNRLQSDKLFLYYMQLGKCMYSGETIDLEQLFSKAYDIDHIYPQAYVKDDSILNNKVLCLSEMNGKKQDIYPIDSSIRTNMGGYWYALKENGLINQEKYKRLTRNTPFTQEEKIGFINRQLTETSQSVKAVATLLKDRYQNVEIVYSKARLVSDFRQQFDIFKSRSFNDLHHAVDAYLNIVTGNVYSMKFTKPWFDVNSRYSIKTETLFTRPLICNGVNVWDGEPMLQKVKKTSVKNNAHFTKYAFFKRGGLFDQMPVPAADGLIPLKKGLETKKYGGYNKASAMFYIPVRYTAGKKTDICIMSVEMLSGEHFLSDSDFARDYAKLRLSQIWEKSVEVQGFPMGMGPWKVNTMLSLDGFRVCISGISSGGKCLIAQPVMQFSLSKYWQFYMKKLEKFNEKINNNPNYMYSEEYDHISVENNIVLYDMYIQKYESSIYSKRINRPLQTLIDGRNKFLSLSINQQVQVLINIHATFGRISGGCDLKLIGGAPKAAATKSFSSNISNWKKLYKDVHIIDQSASGLWTKQSCNILELL